jgi:hypothetical protein
VDPRLVAGQGAGLLYDVHDDDPRPQHQALRDMLRDAP